MQNKGQWHWNLQNKFGRFAGVLDAVDPRDAVSRVLTQRIPFSALLFGQEYEVPVEIIDRAPGNGDMSYEVTHEGHTLRVQRLS